MPKILDDDFTIDESSYASPENLDSFSPEILKRGRDYFENGRVEITYADPLKGEFHANVMGTYRYAVRLDFKGKELYRASCNCPAAERGFCKHEAALLFAIADSGVEAARYSAETKPQKSAFAATPRQFRLYLSSLARSLSDTGPNFASFLKISFPYLCGSVESMPDYAVPGIVELVSSGYQYFPMGVSFDDVFAPTVAYLVGRFPGENALGDAISSFLNLLKSDLVVPFYNAFLTEAQAQAAAAKAVIYSLRNGQFNWIRSLFIDGKETFEWKLLDGSALYNLLTWGQESYLPIDLPLQALIEKNEEDKIRTFVGSRNIDRLDEKALNLLSDYPPIKSNPSLFARINLSRLNSASLGTFLQVYFSMSPHDRESYSYRFEKAARNGDYLPAYRLISAPEKSSALSFRGLSLEDTKILLPYVDQNNPSFGSALLKQTAAIALSGDLVYSASGLFSLIDNFPFLKEVLTYSPVIDISKTDETLRKTYLGLLEKYDLFASLGFRRYL